MSDLNVALLVRLVDQFTTPGAKVVDALRRMKTGAGDFRRAFGDQIRQGFSAENIEAALKRNEQQVAAARGRLMGAFGMALTLGAPVMAAGNFEEQLIRFGNLADLDREKLRALGLELDTLSRRDRTGMTGSELLTGLETYVGKGLSVSDGTAALEATGRAAKATGAQFDEMASAGFAAMDNLKVTPQELRKAFDIMAASGKEGSFELKDMARNFPELTATAQALGIKGVDGVASLAAALQVAMKSAGSADQAANNMSNFLGKLTTPDAVKKFADQGVDIQKELNKAVADGVDPLEHMLGVIQKMTGGDQFKMGELFSDKQVLDFLRAAIPNLEEYRRIKDKAAGADGIIDKDYQRSMEGFNESLRQLRQSFTGLVGASGALLPVFTEIIQSMTGVIDGIRDWTVANPELTAFLVKGAAAALAFGISARVLGYAFAVGRGNLIRFLSLFLKFNAEGRNISLIARALRGLGVGFSWAKVIPKLSWQALKLPRLAWGLVVGMLNWVPFIPKIAWGALKLPKLAWDGLIGILNWATFIPKKLFLRDFGPGVTQIGPAMEQAANRTEAASRRINTALNGIKFRAVSAGLQGLLLASQMPDTVEGLAEFRRKNDEAMEKAFQSTPGVSHLMKGYEWAYEKVHGEPAPRTSTDPRGPLPPPATFSGSAYRPMSELVPGFALQRPAAAGGAGAATAGANPAPVKVEETINHDYKSEHTVTVSVPVTIRQEIKADAAAISRDIGARTEREVRKALSDAAIPE